MAANEVQQQSNETGPQKKKRARPALIAIIYLQENDDEDVATAPQPLSLSPAALPLRVCVCVWGLPLLPTQEAAKPRQQNQPEKKTLRPARHNRPLQTGRAAAPLKKNVY